MFPGQSGAASRPAGAEGPAGATAPPSPGVADLLDSTDWSAASLGPPESWPHSLRVAVAIALASPMPICIAWGPLLAQIYNDAYADLIGEKHPAALGQPTAECWPELWHLNGPIYAAVKLGEMRSFEAQKRTLPRHGVPEDLWFDLTYSPLRDDRGTIEGIWVTVVEVTRRVRAEARLRFRLELEQRLRPLRDPVEILATSAEALASQLGANQAAYADVPEGETHVVVARDWTDGTVPSHVGRHTLEVVGPALFAALKSGRTVAANDIRRHELTDVPSFVAALEQQGGIVALICVPLVKEGRLVALLAVHSVTPRNWLPDDIALAEEVAERSWAEVERAHAEAAMHEIDAKLARAVDSAQVGTWEWDTVADVLTGPRTLEEQFTGRPRGTINSMADIVEVMHPADRHIAGEATRRLLDGETDRYEFEVRTVRPDGTQRWMRAEGRAARDDTGRVSKVSGVTMDVTEQVEARQRLRLLAREVDHRAKNALAVVLSVLRLTRARDMPNFVRVVEGRVTALARAQTLLASDGWRGAELRGLLEGELAAFLDDKARARLEGPPVRLPATATQPIAIALHELAMNALQHGALSVPTGRVLVRWRQEGGSDATLRLRWEESGGPPAKPPSGRPGFGFRMLERSVKAQLGGTVSPDWAETGLVCEITVPLRDGDGAEPVRI